MKSDMERYILSNFDEALENGAIMPYYQPVIRTISGQLCSFEALARWVDAERGVIRPDEFIPVLERERLIHRLDCCVIRQVCARISQGLRSGGAAVPTSVNLSRLDFELCDIFAEVDRIAAQYHIPHDYLHIEITESVMAEEEARMRAIVTRFREAGYQVWMDDFGSGYSSLNLLKDYEFDELKLDMRFLSSFNLRSRRILTSVIQMAKEIDIHTLAEGVETQEQYQYLRNIGCEKVQGYYFGKPLPYAEELEHLRRKGIAIEPPQDRAYYDTIGRINLLSAVPFMTREERDALTNARDLNSIPLGIVEGRHDSFSLLFYNTAFEETATRSGVIPDVFSQETLAQPRPWSLLPARLVHLMDSTRTGREGHMYYVCNEEYYEISAKCIASTREAYSVLFRLNNLSQAGETNRTSRLDEGLRFLYMLFERITLLDREEDSMQPLYVSTQSDLVSGRSGLDGLMREYAATRVYPEDRAAYMRFSELSTLEERLRAAGKSFVTQFFRTVIGHGQYAWKQYFLLRVREGQYVELIRDAHAEMVGFGAAHPQHTRESTVAQTFSPENLWETLMQSGILRVFWKDADRRFRGASKGFLEYYGFASEADILGKNDEDLGWHIRPSQYMDDEMRVLMEGERIQNSPGRCIRNGENREILASKTPIYDENGEIKGLMGYFIDKELLTLHDARGEDTTRRDFLTGLLNSRGIAEEERAYQDEYLLRGIDFIRMHVAIDDLNALNRRYGFDIGDKAIAALGRALKAAFGKNSAVGRSAGHRFVILAQLQAVEDAAALIARVRQVAAGIHSIDGMALTFYLSIGCSLYSETEDLDEQAHKADMRLMADHDEHTTVENRLFRASEVFHIYDDLPISYSVYRVYIDEDTRQVDAELFYVNHLFEARSGMKAAQLLGKRARELFPGMDEKWYDMARRAAMDGETIVDGMYFAQTDKYYYMTASQVIHRGFCSFTFQEKNLLDKV